MPISISANVIKEIAIGLMGDHDPFTGGLNILPSRGKFARSLENSVVKLLGSASGDPVDSGEESPPLAVYPQRNPQSRGRPEQKIGAMRTRL